MPRTSVRRLAVPVLLILLTGAAAVAALLVMASDTQNRTARVASETMVHSLLDREAQSIGALVRDYAWWDASIDRLLIDLDPDWADNNVGWYFNENFDVHASAVLAGDGRVVFSAVEGAAQDDPGLDLSRFDGGLDRLVQRARASSHRARGPVPATGLLRFDGTPVVVAVAALVPEATSDHPGPPDDGGVLIAARVLNGLLDAMAQDFSLTGLAFRGEATAAHPAALDLTTPDGSALATLTWRPPVPGETILMAAMPMLAVVFLAMAVGLWLFLGRAKHLSGMLDTRTRALELSQSRIDMAAAHAPVILFTVSGDERITEAQGRALGGLGLTRDDIVGRSLSDLSGQLPQFVGACRAALRDGGGAVPLSRDDRHYEVVFAPLGDGGVVGVATEVTERERAETELRETLEVLARSNADLERFAYVASHDLQEPLRGIVSYAQLMERRCGATLDAQGRGFLDQITTSTRRLQRMVHDLLEYSRATRVEPGSAVLSVEDCAHHASEALSTAIAESGATLRIGAIPPVLGDATMVTQVLQNLIGNAVKFRRADQPPSITVSAARTDDTVTVVVADDGIGILPDYLEQIFAPFKRLHTQDAYEGSGIGLSICRRFIEAQGGRLWAEAGEPTGTRFAFTLPAADLPPTERAE